MRPFFPWCHCSMMLNQKLILPKEWHLFPAELWPRCSVRSSGGPAVSPAAVCAAAVLLKPCWLCLCWPAWHRWQVTRTLLLQCPLHCSECSQTQPVQVGQNNFCISCPLEKCKLSLSQHCDSWNLDFWAYCILSLEYSHFKLFSFSPQNQPGLSNQLMHQSRSQWNWVNFRHSCR